MRDEFPPPDLVLLLDVLPEVGLDRIERVRGDQPNHFEQLESLTAVREIFLDIQNRDRSSVVLIDGHRSIDDVFADVTHVVVDTALRAKRCAKDYGCDIFYCSFRENGECRWWEERGRLNGLANKARATR